MVLRRQRTSETLRAQGIGSAVDVESAAVTAVRSLLDIDWVGPPRQNASGTARRRDGGRMSISQAHSPRVSKMVLLYAERQR